MKVFKNELASCYATHIPLNGKLKDNYTGI